MTTVADLGAGIGIVVHDKAVYPSLEEDVWKVRAGTAVWVSMQLEEYQFLPKPYSERDCTSDQEPHYLDYPYSEEACLSKCHMDFLYGDCCNIYELDPNATDYCSMADPLLCLATSAVLFEQGEVKCDCLPTCSKTKYNLQITTSKFPNKYTQEVAEFYNWPVQNITEMEKQLIYVKTFFNTMQYTRSEQLASVTQWQLCSSVGGIFGLFLGASVLTILEFLDYFVQLLIGFILRLKLKYSSKKVANKP